MAQPAEDDIEKPVHFFKNYKPAKRYKITTYFEKTLQKISHVYTHEENGCDHQPSFASCTKGKDARKKISNTFTKFKYLQGSGDSPSKFGCPGSPRRLAI